MGKIRNQLLPKKKRQDGQPCPKYKMYIKTGGATMLFASDLTYVQFTIMKNQILDLAAKFDAKVNVSFLKPTK